MGTDGYEPYTNLANAIIMSAVTDYRQALKAQIACPECTSGRQALERFFTSDWFSMLTRVSGREIMKALQKEVAIWAKKKKK